MLIVSYQRPWLLENCLRSLVQQARLPDQILVVGVQGDEATAEVARKFSCSAPGNFVWLSTPVPDVVMQINLALTQAMGDIVCLVDDDAEAFPDWLEQIELHYADPQVGAVGGPDHMYNEQGQPITGRTKQVGGITWFGRLRGNHHLSYPHIVPVDLLKGCNMSFRRCLVSGIDERMSQGGRCHHWELDIAFRIRQQGKTMIYDPAVRVNHYPGPRTSVLDPEWVYMANFNMVLVFSKHFPLIRRLAFLLYTFLWGDFPEMGLAVFGKTYLQRIIQNRDWGFVHLLFVSLRAKVNALCVLSRS